MHGTMSLKFFQNHLEVVDGGSKINRNVSNCSVNDTQKGKVIPFQAWCGPEGG